MPISPLAAVLAAYEPADPAEAADVERLLAHAGDRGILARSSLLHATASALVLHPPSGRVLLRWHPRMKQWMQVGGHFDPGESDPMLVALREAREETGLYDLEPIGTAGDALVHVVIVPVPAAGAEPAHEHADLRYVFTTAHPDDIRPESSAAELKWTPLATAGEEVAEANLRDFLARTSEAFGACRD